MKITEIKTKILAGKEVSGKCYFCSKEVNGEFWCFGCHEFICEKCDKGAAGHGHSVQEHLTGTLWD